eukprot:jgi/Orpsp1_1/1178059/evm.model.c7180000063861.1
MKIHHILTIFFCSGILLLVYTYPIHRYIENEDFIDNEYHKKNSKLKSMKKSDKKTKSEIIENIDFKKDEEFINPEHLSNNESYKSNKSNDDKKIDSIDGNNRDRGVKTSSNNNFFSKFSMKMDHNTNTKEIRKNIMISIKAAPEKEYYYSHTRPN